MDGDCNPTIIKITDMIIIFLFLQYEIVTANNFLCANKYVHSYINNVLLDFEI
jgi:hypothetical protein